jgi:hypothetical protein
MHKLIQTTEPGNRAQRLNADATDIAGVTGNVSTLPLSAAHKQAAQAAQSAELDEEPIKAQAAE